MEGWLLLFCLGCAGFVLLGYLDEHRHAILSVGLIVIGAVLLGVALARRLVRSVRRDSWPESEGQGVKRW